MGRVLQVSNQVHCRSLDRLCLANRPRDIIHNEVPDVINTTYLEIDKNPARAELRLAFEAWTLNPVPMAERLLQYHPGVCLAMASEGLMRNYGVYVPPIVQCGMFGRILLVIATIFLFHAAYSVYEHLSRLKVLGKPEGYLPMNIVYESIFALILGTLGASLSTPPLKDITWASEMKKRTIDEMDSRLGFANYHSRGKPFLVPLPSGRS